ncbi:MAG: hypothetical protein F6K04_06895 [Leptolyngbya sp. SIO4C5]|nr:hypothetical protein [Leptolyngbya sp. SIO4C5]
MNYQHAIITGSSSSIGLAIAYQLVQRGTHLSLIAKPSGTPAGGCGRADCA